MGSGESNPGPWGPQARGHRATDILLWHSTCLPLHAVLCARPLHAHCSLPVPWQSVGRQMTGRGGGGGVDGFFAPFSHCSTSNYLGRSFIDVLPFLWIDYHCPLLLLPSTTTFGVDPQQFPLPNRKKLCSNATHWEEGTKFGVTPTGSKRLPQSPPPLCVCVCPCVRLGM